MNGWRALVEVVKSIGSSERPYVALAALAIWRIPPAIALMALAYAGRDVPKELINLLS